ncbi:uncharacterized protein LOC121718789 isoform X17 [Alosa sapidissima]|uniref:uncharacterized protein LOC121718789 isoform X17 n=1 Tax=Alosa sapidissima TaxID=34773 RepID=UPI001C08EBAB|nr:uncharacterized protein LOC121718789 isoform X17 [Alosa sapidissima]
MDLGPSVSSGGNEAFQLLTPKVEDIKEEQYDHMITCQDDEEEKPLTELLCKTESLGSNEASQTTAEVEVKLEDNEDEEYQDDSLQGDPVSLAQMKRVSVVLVDCCRPQGWRGKEEEMQTNRDAHQIETNPVSLAQMKRVSVVLVDCCRPQGRRGKEEEMQTQTNRDAHQIETNPVSLAQMKRVSVVLVDCCRPQGRRGKEEETQMLTNRDAHQIETKKNLRTGSSDRCYGSWAVGKLWR